MEKKEFKNLKDDVLKLIRNSCICDVKRKGCKKDNKEKDSDVKRKDRKKDNKEKDSDDSENDNNDDNNDNDNDSKNDNDNDNLIDKLLNNNDKLHNFNDKLLNNLFIIAKLKQDFLINIEKIRAIFNKVENIRKNDLRSKLDKYKKLNILIDDLINHIWRVIYGKNRVNNEIHCDIDEDANRYTQIYVNIVDDKLALISVSSDSIDELMDGLDVDTSNDIVVKKLKDFKSILVKLVNIFNSYIKLDTKKKDIEKKDIEKKDTKTSIKHDAKNNNNNNNNKPDTELATSDNIKAHMIDKQKLIKQRYKSLLETKKTIKNNIELIYTALKKLPKELQSKPAELVIRYYIIRFNQFYMTRNL